MMPNFFFFFAFGIFILNYSPVYTQNLINVPADAATIKDAVLIANDNDTIKIASGIYTDSVHVTGKNLIFLGESDGSTILSPKENAISFFLTDADVEFYHLHFNDFDLETPPPNIAISSNYSDAKIHHCTFTNMVSPINGQWGRMEIAYSVFEGSRGTAALLHNGGKFLLYNNLVYDVSNTTFVINRANGHFFNNTLVGSTNDQHFGMIINSDSTTHIFNNSISGYAVGVLLSASDSIELAALKIQNNNVFNVAAPYRYEYNESLSLPIFSGNLIPDPGTGEIYEPAGFSNPLNGDFHLDENSLCIDAGIDLYPVAVPFDLDGNERITGAAPDIGAYEFSYPNSSVNLAEQPAFTVFPQPAVDNISLSANEPLSGTLELLNTSGQVFDQIELTGEHQIQFKLPASAGLYLLRFSGAKGIFTKKVIKIE